MQGVVLRRLVLDQSIRATARPVLHVATLNVLPAGIGSDLRMRTRHLQILSWTLGSLWKLALVHLVFVTLVCLIPQRAQRVIGTWAQDFLIRRRMRPCCQAPKGYDMSQSRAGVQKHGYHSRLRLARCLMHIICDFTNYFSHLTLLEVLCEISPCRLDKQEVIHSE